MDPCRASPGLGGRAGVGGACRWCAPVQSWARLGHREALLAEVPRGKQWGRGVGGRAQETPGSRRVGGSWKGLVVSSGWSVSRMNTGGTSRGLGVQRPRSPVRAAPGWRGALQGSGPGRHMPGLWRLERGGQPGRPREGPSAALRGAGGSLSSWPRVQPRADVLADAFSICWNVMLFSVKYGPQ